MATTNAKAQSKTAFVRDFIGKNPNANRKDVEEAWRAAGHEGPIHSSLVSNVRAERGLTVHKRGSSQLAEGNGAAESTKTATRASKPKRRGRKQNRRASGASAAAAAEQQPRSGGQGKALTEIEEDIDRLIFKLMAVGGFERIENELRKVRRLLYASHQA